MTEVPLSIIIPTKNRKSQCIDTVKAVLAYADEFQLIVFDTSDDTELAPSLDALGDRRLCYVSGPTRLNMTECFERAVALGSGRFVCMIGDDDGIAPSLFRWLERCDRAGFTSVTSRPDSYALYNWPDVTSKYFGSAASGKVTIRAARGDGCKDVDLAAELAEFLGGAGQGCGSLPRVYHGLIRRDILDAMRIRFGRCFDGVSPDVSFSYFASKCSTRHAVVNDVLTISGACAASNAGRSAMRRHKGDLWSDPHMVRYTDEPWPREVPEFFSVETVWAQATLKAIDHAAASDRAIYGFAYLYALCLLRHPDRARETLRAVVEHIAPVAAPAALPFLARVLLRLMRLAARDAFGVARKIAQRIWPDPLVRAYKAASVVEASGIVRAKLGRGI